MSSCNACGSPTSESQIVCEFCGKTLRAVTDAADEVRAVAELGKAWGRIGQDAVSGGALKLATSGNSIAMGQKATVFWEAAFMPTTLDGLLAAGEQAIGLIRPISSATGQSINDALSGRLTAIVDLCDMKGPTDPRVGAFKSVAQRKIDFAVAETKRKVEAAELENKQQLTTMAKNIGVMLAILAVLLVLVALVN